MAIVLIDLFFLQLPGGHYLPAMPILLLLFVGPASFGESAILGAVSLSFWGALGVFVFTRRRGPEAAASSVLVLLLGLIAWYFFSEVKPEPLRVLVLCSLGFALFPLWRPPGDE